jgi:hypothetical protein
MSQTPVFWNFVLYAHYDDVVFRLARLYDREKSGLGLKRFLTTVRSSLEYFSEEAIRQVVALACGDGLPIRPKKPRPRSQLLFGTIDDRDES